MINKFLFSTLIITSILLLTGCKKKDGDCSIHCTNVCQSVGYCEKELNSNCENGQCSIRKNDEEVITLEDDKDYISNDKLVEVIEQEII